MTLADLPAAILASRWSYRLARYLLAFIFVASGLLKLTAPQEFARIISEYGLVYREVLLPVAVGLASLELVAGVALACDARGGLTAISGLLLLFSCVLSYGIWLGLDIECGCFGPPRAETPAGGLGAALVRNVALLALCFYIYWWRVHHRARPLGLKQLLQRK